MLLLPAPNHNQDTVCEPHGLSPAMTCIEYKREALPSLSKMLPLNALQVAIVFQSKRLRLTAESKLPLITYFTIRK